MTATKKKAQVSVYLDPDVMKALSAYAARREQSMSLVAEAAIASFLSPDADERREAAIAKRLDQQDRRLARLERDVSIGVETLAFSSGDNGSQSTLKATLAAGDATHLRLSAEASRAEHRKPAHHEAWTDLLAWREGAPLTTADPGKSAGPWQTRADATRARVAALLTPARTKLTLDMLDPTGLLDPLGSSPQ